MEQKEKQFEIDLIGLFYYLKKRIIFVLVTVLVFAMAGMLYGKLFTTPTYVAESRIYVLNRSSTTGVVGSDFQISTYMLYDYQVLITGKNVTKEVVRQLDLQMTPEALSQKITVTAPEETRVLQINVTDVNAQRAADIANKVCEVAMQELKRLTDADAVHQVYEADVPAVPRADGAQKTTVLAALAGLVLSMGVLTVIFVMDDSIRTEEDVERYLGLSVYGVIPNCTDMNVSLEEKPARRKASAAKKM